MRHVVVVAVARGFGILVYPGVSTEAIAPKAIAIEFSIFW